MIVSRLVDDDWTFGNGIADYISSEQAIYQNVKTRLRSFKNDWYLDVEANVDWTALLGERNNKSAILNEIERVILNTEGVTKIILLECEQKEHRKIKIKTKFFTVYNNELKLEEVLNEA